MLSPGNLPAAIFACDESNLLHAPVRLYNCFCSTETRQAAVGGGRGEAPPECGGRGKSPPAGTAGNA